MKLIAIFCCLPILLFAQKQNTASPGCTPEYFRYVVETLAHDSMKGRLPGTPEEKKSAEFIAAEFRKTGCKPLRKKQYCFPFDYTNPDSVITHSTGNVIAKVDTKSDYCIVITAHYDHIGAGKHHSNDPFSHAIHNGADDNASGVAMLLGLAAWCNEHKKDLQYDIVFAALSAEEDGLFGAKKFLSSDLIDTSKIICNLNFDMLGSLDRARPMLVADGALENSAWDSLLPRDTTASFFVQRSVNVVKGGADHCVFLDANIPSILFSTGLTGFYHRPTDDPSTINYEGMINISTYLQELLMKLNRKKNLQIILR
ncbi:MAG TPA: M20/M25/M40 family metallo-hydrolase [Bacteroidia bacterium]|nr:M20/M25/M40 family metallo-hydrolase [Bacteroidia bacterium]